MPVITMEDFLSDSQGRTFRRVAESPIMKFGLILSFFSDESRQIRMEDSEKHHDRPALAGVIREFENTREFTYFFIENDVYARRLRQAIGVVVRIIMERRGWRKVGKRGSLGQKTKLNLRDDSEPDHNTSGLSWWFCRIERYEKIGEKPYPRVGRELPVLLGGFTDAQKKQWKEQR